jgi:hypothetical protein
VTNMRAPTKTVVARLNTQTGLASTHFGSLYSHFWSRSRVLQPLEKQPTVNSWWKGKVGGDPRSFAQVVSSPSLLPLSSSEMGDCGHDRFGGSDHGGSAGRYLTPIDLRRIVI